MRSLSTRLPAGCLLVVLAVTVACGGGGSTGPSSPGTYSLRLDVIATGARTTYSGPATFNTAGGHTEVICWTDATYTTPLVTFLRALPVTAPDSFGVMNAVTAANNPGTAPANFVVTAAFTSTTATPFGGEFVVTGFSPTSLVARFDYSDGIHAVSKGQLSAIPR